MKQEELKESSIKKRYFNNSITDKKIKPHQIYAAGDLEDPHGTHKVCLDIVFDALDSLKGENLLKIAGYGFIEEHG